MFEVDLIGDLVCLGVILVDNAVVAALEDTMRLEDSLWRLVTVD